ncbi:hypothetical protein ACT4UM_25635, partial [Bacillus sp. SS-TM]
MKKEYELKHITVEYQSSTMQVRENARKAGIGTGVYIKQATSIDAGFKKEGIEKCDAFCSCSSNEISSPIMQESPFLLHQMESLLRVK